jgi:citrate lyase subunit beta/citryl-CoA lyase
MKPLLPKSWMFVPASALQLVDKALTSAAEAVILDLEDAVAEAHKSQARSALAAVAANADRQLWVRINSRHTSWHADDVLAAAANPAIDGILIPKVEGVQDLVTPSLLASGGRGSPLRQGLLIESALGVLNLQTVLASAAPIDMVMFGGAENADLMTDLQCAWSASGTEMMHARQHVLLCARAYPPCQPVDGVYVQLNDAAGLAQETELSRSLGYRARAAIHPRQLDTIHRSYAPTEAELERAERVAQEFEIALKAGRAAVQVAGKLIDYAMYRAACRMTHRNELTWRQP